MNYNQQLATNMLGAVVRRVPTVAIAVIPRMVVGPTRAIVSGRYFSNVSNVISPKSEYSGRSEVVLEHEVTVKKDVLSRVQHDVAPGVEDAPWTPKSQIGKTPMELISEVPPIPVNGSRIACSGGPDPRTGHPMVYFNLDHTTAEKPKACNYCGLRYYNVHNH